MSLQPRRWSLALALAVLCASVPFGAQQLTPAKDPKPTHKITYLLPLWLQYQGAGPEVFAEEVRQLRERLGGDGEYVRLGFSLYVFFDMSSYGVDPANADAVRAEIGPAVAQIDAAIEKARAQNLPICLSVLTAIRGRYDPLQQQAEREDRRNTQWFWSNDLSKGWVTHSRYARKLRRVQEAYIREIGKVLANRMATYPNIVVAASGDGEIELSFDRTLIVNPNYNLQNEELADYSPFAVLEFRDWVRNGGLYAAEQSFEGQGYENAARYQQDPSPGTDGNDDGRTFNGDFGTNFASWDLRYFHWSLDDNPDADPSAIPATTYEGPGFNPLPDAGSTRFDAPRRRQPGNVFWELWALFRQTMVWRHNLDFARWMTTSPDPSTDITIPPDRFFSDQIPADYIFGTSPQSPTYRLDTSASPWWTGDVAPYGSFGVTAFNIFDNGQLLPTLRNVAPRVASREVRWGILEFHSSVPISPNLQWYREDMQVIERYRPGIILPIYWWDP